MAGSQTPENAETNRYIFFIQLTQIRFIWWT